MTWKQKTFDPSKPVIKTSPKQALQREWFVRQGQILGGFHCMYASAMQLNMFGTANDLLTMRRLMLLMNDAYFAKAKQELENAPK